MKSLYFIGLIVSVAFAAFGPFPIDKTQISVSGLSSGGFIAVQVHVALSSKFIGAGIFAGGPYYCAQDQIFNAIEGCLSGSGIDINSLIQSTANFYSQGLIDNPTHLNNSAVFLYSGTSDTVVNPQVMQALQSYYENYGTRIVTQFTIPSEHCLPTDSFGNSCSNLGSPYINNCNYDGAGMALNTIYPKLKPRTTANSNNIVTFSQDAYMPNFWTAASASLASSGYAYVPTACQNANSGKICKLHFAFHGCQQTTDDIGNDFYANGGYNGWAEANNIVVIYPQAVKTFFDPSNPEGCFDWWGYTNANYAVQSGPQIAMIANLINGIIA